MRARIITCKCECILEGHYHVTAMTSIRSDSCTHVGPPPVQGNADRCFYTYLLIALTLVHGIWRSVFIARLCCGEMWTRMAFSSSNRNLIKSCRFSLLTAWISRANSVVLSPPLSLLRCVLSCLFLSLMVEVLALALGTRRVLVGTKMMGYN